MGILYFNLQHAIQEHDKIIQKTGGLRGERDIGLLESALEHMQNDDYYPTFADKLTHLVFSVAMGHAFVDGNKRSSIVLGAYFLGINRYDILIGRFIIEMENIVLWTAEKKISKQFLQEILSDILENGFLTETIKLKIINLLGFEEYPKENNPLNEIEAKES